MIHAFVPSLLCPVQGKGIKAPPAAQEPALTDRSFVTAWSHLQCVPQKNVAKKPLAQLSSAAPVLLFLLIHLMPPVAL